MNDPYIKFNWLLCNLLHSEASLIHFAGGWVICHQNHTLWKATFLPLQLFWSEMSFPGSCLLAGAELASAEPHGFVAGKDLARYFLSVYKLSLYNMVYS